MSGKVRVVKRCPEGHAMEMTWRTCPNCTGREPERVAVADPLDASASGDQIAALEAQATMLPSQLAAHRPAPPPPARRAPPPPAPPRAASAPAPRREPPPPAPAPPPPPPRRAARVLTLVATAGPIKGTRVLMREPRLKIGKSPQAEPGCQAVAVDDQYLSRQHLMVEASGAGWVLHDLRSRNGTMVNGERLEADPVALAGGEEVKAGISIFHVEIGDEAAGE